MKKTTLSILMLSSSLMLAACNDGGSNDTQLPPSATVDLNKIQNPVVGTPTAYSLTDMSASAAESVIMTYKMKGISGNEVQATALVFTPKTAAPAGGWPIVAWAHGTTGVADACAPSRNVINPVIQSMIAKLLAAGYVVVAPDYEGLGEPSGQELHPFLNVKSEGYSIIDAVVATRNWLGNKTSSKWMAVGHSQGGQAALGAAQYATRANLDYKGTVAVAPASHLGLILSAGELSVANATTAAKIPVYASLDTFTALITAGLRNTNPSLQYNQIFKSPTDQIAQKAETVCYDVLGNQFGVAMGQYAAMNGGSLTGYPRTVDGFLGLPLVKTFLDKDSEPLSVQVKTPITIYQGATDTTVPIAATNALDATAKALGTQVNYITNPTWDHSTAYALNVDNIVADVKEMISAQ